MNDKCYAGADCLYSNCPGDCKVGSLHPLVQARDTLAKELDRVNALYKDAISEMNRKELEASKARKKATRIFNEVEELSKAVRTIGGLKLS